MTGDVVSYSLEENNNSVESRTTTGTDYTTDSIADEKLVATITPETMEESETTMEYNTMEAGEVSEATTLESQELKEAEIAVSPITFDMEYSTALGRLDIVADTTNCLY